MACNENIIKNMANEVTRNCQASNVNIEPEFVMYLIELLLLNPKYGKLFAKTLNRISLEHFVNECVVMIVRGGTSLDTLKMQFIMRSNYDKPANLIQRHQDNVNTCLKPLVTEILDADPDPENEAELRKLYRKISIYIILASGLGNPAIIMNLKEGMAALESVFSLEELVDLVAQPRGERMARVDDLLQLASGVRLFNRDCKKGGDMIPDLPVDLVDAGKACLATLSNSLLAAMQRVNSLTTAIDDSMYIHDETGNVEINVVSGMDLTIENYHQIFELLIFNRQYEIYVRRLLSDVEGMVHTSQDLFERCKAALDELHTAVKYKAAVPVVTVFPLFIKLWEIWRSMQHTMYLVSMVNRLMVVINNIQEHTKIPYPILDRMLEGKTVVTDEERQSGTMTLEDRLSALNMTSSDHQMSEMPVALEGKAAMRFLSPHAVKEKHISFLGFCTMCLNVGALVPSNLRIGMIKHRSARFAFSSVKLATRFSRDPDRYTNEVLEYARNHPQIINLLNMKEAIRNVRDQENLVTRYLPKTKLFDKDIQTETHPIAEYKEHNYSSDLWEWKRRACQWAKIVNCKTHSTQTHYSHMRSEIHCQTVEPRDKCLQTKKTTGMNTNTCNFYVWGLRGQIGDTQHSIDMVPKHSPKKAVESSITQCTWPCVGEPPSQTSSGINYLDSGSDDQLEFYKPDI